MGLSGFGRLTLRARVRTCSPEISEAMDGRREAHRDVLVAVSGKPLPPVTTTEVLHASGLDA